MHCWGFCIPHLWYLLAHLSSTTCWLLTVGIELLLSEPQIFTSVKTSNACLIGLLSVSQELIPRKFLSSCLSHALIIMPVSKVAQLCPTHCDPMDCSLPGSSIHGIFQVRVLEWVAISFSRGSSQPGDWIQVSHIAGRHFTIWATREALNIMRTTCNFISLEGKAFPAVPTSLLEEKSLIPTEQTHYSLSLKVPFIRRPLYLFLLCQTFLLMIGVVGVMVAAIPWTALPVIPLGIIFFVLQWYFLRTSRDVKRLECTSEYRGSQVGMAVQAGFYLCHN